MWATITAMAKRQQGVLARWQLAADGLNLAAVDGLVRRGRLLVEARGVYVVAGSPATPLRDVMVAVLRCGPGAVAVGSRLLAATGVHHLSLDGPFTILVPAGRRISGVGFPVRPDRWPSLGGRATAAGVPTVSRARNLLELAVDAPRDLEVREAADAYRWVRGGLADVVAMAASAPDHGGAGRLLLLGLLDDDAAQSEPERRLERLVLDLKPERQVALAPNICVDLLIRRAKLVLQYDGRGSHGSDAQRMKDQAQDAVLRALGYAVLRVRAADLAEPARLRARIDALVASRTA